MSDQPRNVRSATANASLGAKGDEVELAPPGMLGRNWGAMTPIGVLTGHAVYGAVAALVYGSVA